MNQLPESGNQWNEGIGHGPRMSLREYEKSIVALHSGLPPIPGKQQEIDTRRRELDLTIDYRLGKNFPDERREALWEALQRVEKKRGQLVLHWLTHFISYKWLYKKANRVAKFVVDEYAKVLSKDELEAYFGTEESEHPSLPIDNL